MAGHVCLSIPVVATSWLGIVLVAVGTGFIKPNLSTIVGGLYDDDDIRCDAGFQLFYMSINVGAFASPLLIGWLRSHYGYHVGFSSAAVGMALALAAFIHGRNRLSAFASVTAMGTTGALPSSSPSWTRAKPLPPSTRS